MGGKTSTASKNKHLRNTYDRPHSYVMPKGRRAVIEACAAAEGLSIAKWMNEAIVEKVERYNASHPDEIIDINGVCDVDKEED